MTWFCTIFDIGILQGRVLTMCVRLGVAVVKLHLAFGRGLPARCMVHTPLGPLRHSW